MNKPSPEMIRVKVNENTEARSEIAGFLACFEKFLLMNFYLLEYI
jgi:hypothetical protein